MTGHFADPEKMQSVWWNIVFFIRNATVLGSEEENSCEHGGSSEANNVSPSTWHVRLGHNGAAPQEKPRKKDGT